MTTAWPDVPLGDLCDIQIGKTPPRARAEYWGPGQPWLSIADMSQGRSIGRTTETITDQAITDCNCRLVPPGTLLLSFKLSIGKVGITSRAMYTNEAIAQLPIRDPTRLDVDYLARALERADFSGRVDRAAMGSTLNKEKLRQIKILLPPIKEQRRIAAILDQADELRSKRRATIKLLDNLIVSIFADAFGNPDLNEYGWPTTTLGQVLSMGPQNGIYKHATQYGSGVRILRIDSFDGGVVPDLASLKRVQLSESEVYSYRLQESDIVINRVNSRSHLGKSAIVPPLDETVVFESNMMRLRLDSDVVLPEYVIHLLQSGSIRRQILNCCKDAVNQSSINQEDVRGLRVIVPPLDAQRRFAVATSRVALHKATLEADSRGLDDLFDSLRQGAFRGEL